MRKILKSLSSVLAFAMILSCFGIFSGVLSFGSSPISIGSVEELRKIGTDSAYPLNGSYLLTADLDLSKGGNWKGIGGTEGFGGTFDGGGHVISGMHAGSASSVYSLADNHAWGFFPILNEGAVVKNLAFRDVYYNGLCTETNTAVGAVAGYTNQNNVVIENVAVLSGTLNASCVRQTRVGGIIGVARASKGTTIRNCFNGASIQGDYTSTAANCYLSLGGIAGYYSGSGGTVGIYHCFNAGNVVAKKTSGTTNYSSVGAIAALANTTGEAVKTVANLSNCFTLVGILDYDSSAVTRISRFVSDANAENVKEISLPLSGVSASYSALVTGSGNGWAVKDGFLPIPSVFADLAVSASGETVESFGKAVLDSLYVNNALTKEQIVAALEKALGQSITVVDCTLHRVDATKETEGEYKILATLSDGTTQYTISKDGKIAFPQVVYAFSRDLAGCAEGTITVTDSNFVPSVAYSLCWGTSAGLLQGYAPLAKQESGTGDLLVSDAEKGILTYKTPNSIMIPEGATHLWLTVNGEAVSFYEVDPQRLLAAKKPEYSFGTVSDTHFGSSGATAAFKAAMELYEETVSFVLICGDVSEGGAASQYRTYTDLYSAQKYTLPIWVTLGNHDILAWNLSKKNGVLTVKPKQAYKNVKEAFPTFANPEYPDPNFKVTVGNTETTSGCEDYQMDYTMAYGDDLYIFLCVGPQQFPNEQTSPKQPEALSDMQIVWLSRVLYDYYQVQRKSGQVFLLFHYYIAETGMDMTPGFGKWDAASSKKLHNLLVKYPEVIHFSGHNHFAFDDDENIYDDTYASIHVPSLSKGVENCYEGYIVERYADSIAVKGYDFGAKQYIPHAMFLLPIEHHELSAQEGTDSIPDTESSEPVSTDDGNFSDIQPSDTVTDIVSDSDTSLLSEESSSGWILPLCIGLCVLLVAGAVYYFLVMKKKKV